MFRITTICLAAIGFTIPLFTASAFAQDSEEPVKLLHRPGGDEGQRLINAGQFAEAAEYYRTNVDANPADARSWFMLGYSLHGAGRLTEALPVHLMAAEWPQNAPIANYNAACVYSLWNQPDKAFSWLNKALAAGFNQPQTLRDDPDMVNIRKDPRFTAVLNSLEHTPEVATTAPSHPEAAVPADVERQFDFWVGEWDVYNTNGQQVGKNVIEKRLAGQLIFESWTSAGGGRGQSMNFYDPIERAWRQVWVSQFGDVIEYAGHFETGAMRFTGTYRVPGKAEEMARSSFTPRDDGSVHQLIEHSADKGGTWYTYFDGVYIKSGSDAPKTTTTGDQN